MEPTAALLDEFEERILDLSADAQVRRRAATKDSPEFNKLTGAIAAYGKLLALLTTLRRLEKFYATVGGHTADYSHTIS